MSKAPAYFDQKKLDWMNAQYIKSMSIDELTERTMELIKEGETEEAKRLQSIPEDQLTELLRRQLKFINGC